MSLMRKFTEHPTTVSETYGQHFVAAMGFSIALLRAAFFCGVHAILPFLFEKTGSQCITEIYERMVANRDRRAKARASEPEIA